MSRMQAQRWNKKVGDTFTMISKQIKRADGKTAWDFKVLTIAEDIPQAGNGFIFGNYDYIDKAKPLADQGKVDQNTVIGAMQKLGIDPSKPVPWKI